MRRDRTRMAAGTWLAIAALVAVTGCGKKDDFEDRTAQVTVAGKTAEFTLDSCGLEKRTIFVVGRADDGRILQGVMALKADKKTGIPTGTGFSITEGDEDYAAFGAESWAAKGGTGTPPGKITSARLRGSRIQFGAVAQPVTADLQTTAGESVTVSIDARCDDRDDPSD